MKLFNSLFLLALIGSAFSINAFADDANGCPAGVKVPGIIITAWYSPGICPPCNTAKAIINKINGEYDGSITVIPGEGPPPKGAYPYLIIEKIVMINGKCVRTRVGDYDGTPEDLEVILKKALGEMGVKPKKTGASLNFELEREPLDIIETEDFLYLEERFEE